MLIYAKISRYYLREIFFKVVQCMFICTIFNLEKIKNGELLKLKFLMVGEQIHFSLAVKFQFCGHNSRLSKENCFLLLKIVQ